MSTGAPSAPSRPHPLAPLSEDECLKVRDALIKFHGPDESLFFRSLYLKEPLKAELVPFLEAEHAGNLTPETSRPSRLALVEYDVVKPEKHIHTRSDVNVETGQVVSHRPAEEFDNPSFTVPEFAACEEMILKSQEFQDAVAEFVIPEGFKITVDPWPYGGIASQNPRYMQGLVFARNVAKGRDSNHYAYPIPIIPVLDWVTKKIIRIDRLPTGGAGDGLEPAKNSDSPKNLFTKARSAEYVPELLKEPLREGLKPLNVVQPEGASFSVHPDGLIEWQHWRFRLGFTPREGAVLHDVCYEGRPVAYRLSYSELTVPYGDPRPPFHRKQAFDFGDGGVGRAANNLELGCDCLGAIHYVDSWLVSPDGTPSRARNVVCLHEQDAGVLWKHTDFRTGRAVAVRSREFVVQFICTLANYEYILAFKLDLAGGITLETRATGILSVVSIDEGKRSDYGNIVAPGVLAQNHQHIFAARIDPAIDSYRDGQTRVVVEESRSVKMDPNTNPYGNLYQIHREPVDRATWVDTEPRLNRQLRLENTVKKNAISGKNVGYKLVVPATQMMLADEDGVLAKRAPFARHNAWVTGYRDGELWAAGEFTNQSCTEKGGVAAMVKRGDWFIDAGEKSSNRHAANGDENAPMTNGNEQSTGRMSSPVVWAVYGFTHNPRVEDWPVMPYEAQQIHLRPADFFERNPALDVPSKRNEASVLVPCCGAPASAENSVDTKNGGSVQADPQSHLQGSGEGADPKAGGARTPEAGERRLSRVLTGLFRSKGKGNNDK
ncbi:hypothetical protein HIM_05414 [Hirsutella minnesotensis 3608]|uniref:Amine oxidase n=1 Tax=Hirsutella minnesotensis 3608 TaxID=1043627 RepID=A0A0F7ZPB7_9HYPO|nr:hypothetical protein HIM_05414 [Hirsutella minnesotensis 3608]